MNGLKTGKYTVEKRALRRQIVAELRAFRQLRGEYDPERILELLEEHGDMLTIRQHCMIAVISEELMAELENSMESMEDQQ